MEADLLKRLRNSGNFPKFSPGDRRSKYSESIYPISTIHIFTSKLLSILPYYLIEYFSVLSGEIPSIYSYWSKISSKNFGIFRKDRYLFVIFYSIIRD